MVERLKRIYLKYKEIILYIIFGGLTTVVDWAIYFPLVNLFDVYYQTANVIGWIAAVLFAYIVNKIFVFESKRLDKKLIFKEFSAFTISRLFSLLSQIVVMYIFVELLGQSENLFKMITAVLVVILNYIFGKFVIFVKKE